MKKLVLFSVILLFAGLNVSMAQMSQTNTIPVYNYPLTEESTLFQEPGQGTENCEKRDMTVVVTSSSKGEKGETASILIVKKDGSETMGPFTIVADEPFTVTLPKGKWGVIVTSRGELETSIWINRGESEVL
jgi:hypothetical protein